MRNYQILLLLGLILLSTGIGAAFSAEPAVVGITITKPGEAPTASQNVSANALATGSFGKSAKWALIKVKVTGAILSVEFEVEGNSCENEYIKLNEISYIDENNAKKFTLLKDEGGQPMAGPIDTVNLQAKACGGKAKMWMKFPAPPPETKTITINLSQLGSLDSIPVQR